MYKTLALALAAVAAATPIQVARQVESEVPYYTVLSYNNSNFTLNAVQNGTEWVLEAERASLGLGTEAYSIPGNGSYGFNISLNYLVDDSQYGAFTPEVGDEYGTAQSVFLLEGEQQTEWAINNGRISHELSVALNAFFACEDQLVGSSDYGLFLKWGTPNNDGSAPEGCDFTNVFVNSNS